MERHGEEVVDWKKPALTKKLKIFGDLNALLWHLYNYRSERNNEVLLTDIGTSQ